MTPETVHDGETLDQARHRFWLNVRHPFTRHPEARNRYGWLDLLAGHAVTNLYVTYARERPRSAGHLWRYSVLVLLVAVVAVWIWL
jgi:hypothetical protein